MLTITCAARPCWARELLSPLPQGRSCAVDSRAPLPKARVGRLNHPSSPRIPSGGTTIMATATKAKKKSSGNINIQPLGDRVVIEREETEERTAGGIVLPDAAREKPARGRVISVGTGRLLDDGSRSTMQVKKGDRVLFASYAGDNIKIGEDEYLL